MRATKACFANVRFGSKAVNQRGFLFPAFSKTKLTSTPLATPYIANAMAGAAVRSDESAVIQRALLLRQFFAAIDGIPGRSGDPIRGENPATRS